MAQIENKFHFVFTRKWKLTIYKSFNRNEQLIQTIKYELFVLEVPLPTCRAIIASQGCLKIQSS